MSLRVAIRSSLLAGSMLGVAASAALAGPDYSLLTTVAIPASSVNNQGGAMTAFDISFVDPVTGTYYFADRSNGAVDIINGNTAKFIAQAGVGSFGGQQASTATSGPDGVVVYNNGTTATLYAGNGDPNPAKSSTLLTFNVTNPASPALLNTTSTGGTFRVDEMAFAPNVTPGNNLLLAANNAEVQAFATLFNTNNPIPTLEQGNITVPGQAPNGGMEQSVWDPKTGTFFVSIPSFNGTDAGGVQEISASGTPLRQFNFTTMGIASCSPSGLALGGSGNLMVGCGNAGTQTVVLNPTGSGTIVDKIASVSGSDELWYDPVTGNFYVTGVDAAGNRVIDVINDSVYSLLQSINLTALGADHVNAHSVAVNPLNGDIFVPLEGTTSAGANALCPLGCVAVFAAPEPGSLPILVVGLAGLIGLAVRRRLQ